MKTLKKELFDGKFEIQGEIAKGQTGTILYGYDLGLRQEVAIKIYHSHINNRVIRGKAFVEKSSPLLLLDHPNLIKIFKVEEEEDTPVIFMEFFDAPSLQQLIHDKGPLPIQDMLMLAREITEVLVHTHFQGIIHGTLHPGHVLVGLQGQIKVLDLGLSWILMDILSNCDPEILRPLPYFPPEIAKEELLNVSSDLYSLGFMMYEMLTGTVPYAGLPKTSIMGKLAFDQADPIFDFPDTVPEAICDLIRHMTHNNTQHRLQDATHVLTIINQQLQKLPISKKSIFLAPVAPQPQAPPPKDQDEPAMLSTATTTPLTTPNPAPKTAPIQRPQASMKYSQARQTTMLRKVGITLGLIVLVALAGGLGYWYRDILEPHLSILQEQPEGSSPLTNLPATRSIEDGKPVAPAQDAVNLQELPSGSEELRQQEIPPLALPIEPKHDALSNPTSRSQKPEAQPKQSTVTPLPKTRKTKQESSLVPLQKQPISKQPKTSGNPTPSKMAPAIPEIASPPTTKAVKKAPVQPAMAQQPPVSNQSITPLEKLPAKRTSAGHRITPSPTTNATKIGPLKSPATLKPAKENINQKNESAISTPSSGDIPRQPIDEEIEDILQSLDTAKEDLSSIAVP